MKIIIPLAGKGTRLQPFTYSVAKPLVPVAGKPVLEHIMEHISNLKKVKVEEVVFIIGYLGHQIVDFVEKKNYPFKVSFVEQKQLMGQAHAIKLAEEHINTDVVIWFVDTIADADLDDLYGMEDGAIYVKRVEDPRRFGQVKEENGIVKVVKEKADPPVSDLVNIGLYYVKNYKLLLESIDELIEKDMKTKGEFYLMDAFNIMIEKGAKFKTMEINIWEDCGKPDALLSTNVYLLEKNSHYKEREGVTIKGPVYIDDRAEIKNSTIGPYASIGKNAKIENSRIENSIIMDGATITNSKMKSSIIGNNAVIKGKEGTFILGDKSIAE